MTTPCAICGDTEAEFIALHHSGDPYERDAPYRIALCRECPNGMIAVVKAAVKRMKEERNATNA